MRLGFHLSIAGALSNAPKEAAIEKYGAFQIFTTSSRSWKNSEIDPKDREDFVNCTRTNDLVPFAHIPYLCNPASTNSEVYGKSKDMLLSNMMNCETLGIGSLVIHLGSHLGKGIDIGISNICGALSDTLGRTENVRVLLENGSGYSNCVGSKFSDIGKIIDTVGSDRVGVCFDTCHAFAAGYDLRDDEKVDNAMKEFDDSIGLSRLGLIHLNDAKHPLGSGLDRHMHIGQGYIGTSGFTSLFRNRAFSSGSFVMELPEDEEGDHSSDMRTVKSIIGKLKG